MNDRLLTARELADQFGVSPETVLRWTRRGDLIAIKLPGGAIRYRPEALADWLDEHETRTGGGPRGVSPPRGATRPAVFSPTVTAPDPPEED